MLSTFGRIYEGDPSEITTLCEAEYQEQILEETLRRVHMRKVREIPLTFFFHLP